MADLVRHPRRTLLALGVPTATVIRAGGRSGSGAVIAAVSLVPLGHALSLNDGAVATLMGTVLVSHCSFSLLGLIALRVRYRCS